MTAPNLRRPFPLSPNVERPYIVQSNLTRSYLLHSFLYTHPPVFDSSTLLLSVTVNLPN